MDLGAFTTADIIGLAGFLLAWAGYASFIDHGPLASRTLSALIDVDRRVWIEQVQGREVRIADAAILTGLQQGTGFFASASLLGIGAGLAVIGSSDAIQAVINDLLPDQVASALPLEDKVIGLMVIFVYAFFKYAWAYRLYNYAAVLVGALPPAGDAGTPAAGRAIRRAAEFLRLAGRSFNHGQRAFFFSLAYLGWLAGPWVLLAGSAFVLGVLLHRQFWSKPAQVLRS